MVEEALCDILDDLCGAVDEETTAQLSEHQRTRIPLSDGRLLGHGADNEYLYAFACGSDVTLPDESPIQLILGSYRTHGILVSSEREAVTLAIEEDLGDEVNSADMVPTPWELMERLKEQLQLLRTRADVGLLRQSVALQPTVKKARAYVAADVVAELNEGQRNAVHVCLDHELSFVWGPPGTGKSTTVARVVQQLVLSGRRVVVAVHSNAAVDVVIIMLEPCSGEFS